MAREPKRKEEVGHLVEHVRTYNRPDPFKVPKKNPTLHYRFVRNTPESISEAQARGYDVANSEVCRQAGIEPRGDGSHKVGDTVLAVTPFKNYRDRQEDRAQLAKRQADQARDGYKGRASNKGFSFSETVKQD